MAFNKDTKSIFDRYVNNILEAVKPTEEEGPLFDINKEKEKLGKAIIAGRADTSTAAGQAAVAQNQANIASAAATTAAQTKANDEYYKDNRFGRAKQNSGLVSPPGPSTVSTGPAIPVPSPTPAATPSPTSAVTPSPAPTGRSEQVVQDELNAALKNKDQAKAGKLFDELAAVRKQTGAPNQATDLLKKYPVAGGRSEQVVQDELNAALNNKDQAKAGKLFDELAAVRKQTGAPNQATDLLKKYPVAGDSTSSQPGAPVQQPVAGTAQKAGVYTPDQLAAFQAANKSTFDPNSSMDRGKMLKMLGRAPANGAATGSSSSSLPGAGMKPGQIKTPTANQQTQPGGAFNPGAQVRPAIPVSPQETQPGGAFNKSAQVRPAIPVAQQRVPNSSLPGVAGSISNLFGRAGDTIQNIATGQAGTGAQARRPGTPPTPPKR